MCVSGLSSFLKFNFGIVFDGSLVGIILWKILWISLSNSWDQEEIEQNYIRIFRLSDFF